MDKMFQRTDELEVLCGPLSPREKTLVWMSYCMARLDADLNHKTKEAPTGIMNSYNRDFIHYLDYKLPTNISHKPIVGDTIFVHYIKEFKDRPDLCKLIALSRDTIRIQKNSSYETINRDFIHCFEPYWPL